MLQAMPKVSMSPQGVKIGYYRQDFSNLDFDKTVFEDLNGFDAKEN
jgi:hypothetical protein